jgi:hypothetical protein
VETSRPRYRWAVTVYDQLYRSVHGLDRPASGVGPALCIAVRRSYRTHHLSDGTIVHPADLIGVIHLNNGRVAALHADARSPLAVGLQFRRQVVASLQALAVQAGPGARLAALEAFTATTIFHDGLRRFGFDVEDTVAWPSLVAAYQRALLASLHPAGWLRPRRARYQRACRLWLSRRRLLESYGRVIRPGASATTTTPGIERPWR